MKYVEATGLYNVIGHDTILKTDSQYANLKLKNDIPATGLYAYINSKINSGSSSTD